MLYIADVRQVPLEDILVEEGQRAAVQPQRSSSWPYAQEIARGIVENGSAIDSLIQTHAHGWTIARMPAVDRAILRVAIWEILHNDEVPAAVAISEAIDFATVLSTEDSAAFIHGVLGALTDAR